MDLKLKNKLRMIFNKHDPMRICFGKKVNFDEYDPEIKQLQLIFDKTATLRDFTSELYKLFQRMFSPDIVGHKAKYTKLAKEVYLLMCP